MNRDNETIRQLLARKSVRSFTDQEITPEEKKLILEAAVQAPTAGNQQLYTILDITDQKLKDRLVDTCDHQPMIAKAKLVLIFCADYKKWYDGFLAAKSEPREPGTGDLMLAVCDAMIAAQNAVAAAESMGIGSCYIGDIMENCEEQQELLHLPEYVLPVGMLIFGYSTQQQKDRVKPERVAMEYVVHENGYQVLSDMQLKDMWRPRCGEKTFEEWMDAFCRRKYNSDFSREMTRSVQKYLDQVDDLPMYAKPSALSGKRIFFLGSSVTYGAAGGGVSFADYVMIRKGCESIKEAVSGTTLVDKDQTSYIARMKNKVLGDPIDLFVCQLSTNDATQGLSLGKVTEGFNIEGFDTKTIAGAIEYVIAYAKENYQCPVAFYTNPKYDSEAYKEMVELLYRIREKWDIYIFDLWGDAEFNQITESERARYMNDPIHPTREGYLKWWTPFFEEKLGTLFANKVVY